MQIALWNAYASNNSGSYTIIGRFADAATPAELAKRLEPVLKAQSAAQGNGESPLRVFAASEGVPLDEHFDWPEYGRKEWPEVVALGNQLLIHHDYTVSLPAFFGHWIYAKGGRVETELDHAHHPVIAVFDIMPTNALAPILEWVAKNAEEHACHESTGQYDPHRIAATFEDLVAGCAGVFQRAPTNAWVRLFEAPSQAAEVAPFVRR